MFGTNSRRDLQIRIGVGAVLTDCYRVSRVPEAAVGTHAGLTIRRIECSLD